METPRDERDTQDDALSIATDLPNESESEHDITENEMYEMKFLEK